MEYENLSSALQNMTARFWNGFLEHLPQLVLVVGLLAAGWVLGRLPGGSPAGSFCATPAPALVPL